MNITWSVGPAYTSIHHVHRAIVEAACPGESVANWAMQGIAQHNDGDAPGGVPEVLSASRRTIRGRGMWVIAQRLLQRRLEARVRTQRPRIALLDGIGVARVMLRPLARCSVPAVVIFHGNSRLQLGDRRLLTSLSSANACVRLVAVSETLAQSLREQLQQPVEALITAVDPLDFRQNLFSKERARQALGLAHQQGPVLGAVGRLVADKNFAFLLEVLAKLQQGQASMHLVIVGDGAERGLLEQKIQALDLGGSVTLAGFRADARSLYRAFDAVLIPSVHEGLGLVVQESVMAGVPVLCSDLPVFHEQLADAGIYLPLSDSTVWMQAINAVMGEGLGSLAARQRYQFALQQRWERFVQGYRALLGSPPSSA